MSEIAKKKQEWLKSLSKSAWGWDDLADQDGWNGQDLQEFWRSVASARRPLTDEEMIEKGLLKTAADGHLYHIAYIPWLFHDASLQKKDWNDQQWDQLRNAIKDVARYNISGIRSVSWERLTIPSDIAEEFLKSEFKRCHLVGAVAHQGLNVNRFHNNLIDGDLNGQINALRNLIVDGSFSAVQRPLTVQGCSVREIVYTGDSARDFNVVFSDSSIETFKITTRISDFSAVNSSFGQILCESASVGRFSAVGDGEGSIALKLTDSSFSGRFLLSEMKVLDEYHNQRRSFAHAKFQEKVRIINCKIPLSVLADVQLEAPIDIDFDATNPEDVFEKELTDIRGRTSEDFPLGEKRRRRLERACQIICDRHRQDGRKDMEHRFRRMELKARAYREGAGWDTKVLTRAYDFFSDFGRSLIKPLRGLAIIWTFFFCAYWLLGALALELPFFADTGFSKEAFTDAALLSSDKTFPFGASVDETELFSDRLLGADAGFFAVFAGILGAIQLVSSGVMIFLCGLSIRTKLLIG